MRPHVEIIQESDLHWRSAELPGSAGEARQRNLSVDEETGAGSFKIEFVSECRREPGWHTADTEWYVLSGAVKWGSEVLGSGDYIRAPAKAHVPRIAVTSGTQILLFRERGDHGFTPAEYDKGRDETVIVRTTEMPWQKSDRDGLSGKILYQEPSSGAVTTVARAEPGWTDPRFDIHPCTEEAFTLQGSATYNFGALVPGTYLHRPPWVKHGDWRSGTDGCEWLIRTNATPATYFVHASTVSVTGPAAHEMGSAELPVAGIPLRTRSTGDWSGFGR